MERGYHAITQQEQGPAPIFIRKRNSPSLLLGASRCFLLAGWEWRSASPRAERFIGLFKRSAGPAHSNRSSVTVICQGPGTFLPLCLSSLCGEVALALYTTYLSLQAYQLAFLNPSPLRNQKRFPLTQDPYFNCPLQKASPLSLGHAYACIFATHTNFRREASQREPRTHQSRESPSQYPAVRYKRRDILF